MHQHRAFGGILSAGVLAALLAMTLIPSASQAADTKQTVTEGKNVSLEYTLKLDDKSVVESNVGKQPLTYTHGTHQIVPGLEKALEGLTVGDTKEVTVAPADGYGEKDPEALQEVQKKLIPPDALVVGSRLQGQAPDGHMVYPQVAEIKDDTVVLDFNHPLAGKTLHFDVKILDIKQEPPQPQEPTPKKN
ncbi:MAG TPA: peptidylprolyl isomerase [Candidatus Saccharimonadia bacterium]|nr:peptidylprolyl isomerase [Candidatus Saccharimonadia bacterium]